MPSIRRVRCAIICACCWAPQPRGVSWGCSWTHRTACSPAEELFHGTLTQTSVYPRQILVRALHHNAAGVILRITTPPASAEPSQADRWLTDQLKTALGLVDVKVIDHFIVAGSEGFSFCERGWL